MCMCASIKSLSWVNELAICELVHCFYVQETNSDTKLSEITAALSVPLQLLCNCSLSVQRHFFSCLATVDSQTVVFLAELSYTVHPSVDMSSLLTSWVTSTRHIIVASTQLQVDSTCPVVIDSLEPKRCPVTPHAGPSTSTTTDATTVLSTGTEVAIVAGAVCASVLILVIITVAIVIAVVVFCRRRSKYRYILHMPHYTTLIMSLPIITLSLHIIL